ncbi:MAG: hypothetical protein WDM77_04820 [Steroidobacteraceae bacterium]
MTSRTRIISLLLLVLVTRALVPAGFMPAGDGSAQLTLCPDGMLMPSDPGTAAAAMPGSGHLHTDHCPFGSAPFAAPLADLAVVPARALAVTLRGIDSSSWVPEARAARTHQPRAPPPA